MGGCSDDCGGQGRGEASCGQLAVDNWEFGVRAGFPWNGADGGKDAW